ncbi:ParA family protein [Roseivivax marinus]|uniref:ParA family protein n=1 Tax=Roseivivax marinus TaxID=1379903 RepID=W4HJS3_9RHOB|nr:ParA family partition ATPase [Roseivivax marinus]ETW12250.1 ParA family protein [Roseivivax marinus]UMA64440.1 ParA family protein [Roseivivax marinus]SEK19469.1 chromosome partitioning protein [Roseivivax marinus]
MGSVITVAQQKGGSGKTTLAANLAVGFLRQGRSVAIVDTDPQGSLGRWFMTRIEAAPDAEPDMEFATSSAWGITYETRKLARTHDVVIVDTPPKADSDLRPALRIADLVVVPVSMSHVDLWATEGVIDLARREGKEALVVLNRARANTRLGADVAEQAQTLMARIAATQIANRVIYAEALGQGRGAAEGARTPARDEVDALTREVADLLETD